MKTWGNPDTATNKDYQGETINTNLIIQGGQKHFETQFSFFIAQYHFLIFTPWLTVMLNLTLGLLDLMTCSPPIDCSA